MNFDSLKNLQESYLGVYGESQEEVICEEAQLAAHYFESLGLNEEGVEIFAEQLGSEDFYNFIMEISEDYVLSEATALTGKRPAPSPKGSEEAKISRKAKASTTTKKLVKAGGSQMKSGRVGNTMSKTKRAPAAKVAQATQTAKAAQPKKRPGLDGIARAINKGMERHRKAMGLAKETGKTLGKVAKTTQEAGRRLGQTKGGKAIKKGIASGLKAAANRMSEQAIFQVADFLISEGYVEDFESAYDLMEELDDDIIISILTEE